MHEFNLINIRLMPGKNPVTFTECSEIESGFDFFNCIP